jgi:hypothetical protein
MEGADKYLKMDIPRRGVLGGRMSPYWFHGILLISRFAKGRPSIFLPRKYWKFKYFVPTILVR